MRCSEIMKTDIECLEPQDTAEHAAAKMRDQNVGFLPVCDEQKKVLGALTDRDITTRLVAEGKPGGTPAEQIMTSDCVACGPDDDVEAAQRLMAKHQKSRIMCVDEDGVLKGVISLSDVAQHDGGARTTETLRQVTSREAKAAKPQQAST
jgi:CBS domain-containing protein